MPAIARIGDPESPVGHCTQPKRLGHSKNVFANGRGVSCQGHLNAPHKLKKGKKCVGHQIPLKRGSRTVFANGRPVGRVGDPTCTWVIKGSPNVFAG